MTVSRKRDSQLTAGIWIYYKLNFALTYWFFIELSSIMKIYIWETLTWNAISRIFLGISMILL